MIPDKSTGEKVTTFDVSVSSFPSVLLLLFLNTVIFVFHLGTFILYLVKLYNPFSTALHFLI